jgi:type IV pilus assembly protein PilC
MSSPARPRRTLSGHITPRAAPRTRVAAKNLAMLTRQLAVMVDAGLPLVQCLDLLVREEPDRRLREAIAHVRMNIERGASLAEAMRRRPDVFDALYTSMVAAGEAGGVLDVVLERLAVLLEQRARLVSQVRSAAAYPVAVLIVAALVVMAILWKVVPTFTALFEGLGATLPAPTVVLIWMSRTLVAFFPVALAGMVLGVWLFRRYYATPVGRIRVDRLILRVPMLGGLMRQVAVARFCRTLSTLLSSGVPILDGLDITAETAGNAVVASAVKQVRQRIEQGETIARPLRASGVFPPMVAQLIGVGEHTGALDAMLARIARFYEDEVDASVRRLLAVMEPALISALGVVVGGIVVSMYLPLFELIGQLS